MKMQQMHLAAGFPCVVSCNLFIISCCLDLPCFHVSCQTAKSKLVSISVCACNKTFRRVLASSSVFGHSLTQGGQVRIQCDLA